MAKVVGYGLQVASYLSGIPWLAVAGRIIVAGDAAVQSRRAKRQARAAANAALQDRLEMVDVTPDQARTIVLGRVRTVEGVRRRWVSGENSQRLTLIVSFAGHEIDGFEQFFFDDVPLQLDAAGYVQTEPYLKGRRETESAFGTLDGNGAAVINLPRVPIAGTVRAVQRNDDLPGNATTAATVVGVAGQAVTVSGFAGAPVTVIYEYTVGTSSARIRSFAGAPGQNVGATLAAEYPGKISASDRFAGMAVAVVDIDFDPDVYVQGVPNVTAVLRGAKVLDVRTGVTAWSENPALHHYFLARHPNVGDVPAAEIQTSDYIRAADVCDQATNFSLRTTAGATSTVTLPRYRSGVVVATDADPADSMASVLQSMAGEDGWAGGVLRVRAGAMAAPVATITPAWLAQRTGEDGEPVADAVVSITNGVARDARINRVTGSCVQPGERWQVLPYPAVQDSALIAAKGLAAQEVDLPAVNHIAHAQHLGTVLIRQAQAALRGQLQCNLYAWPVEIFDVLQANLPRYGMVGKTFEVIGWRWHPTEGVSLRVSEITPAIFTPVAELTGVDPAPNSSLPRPWQVEDLLGLTVTSGTSTLTDGSVLTRTRLAWTPAVGQSVRAGGKVQVQYAEVVPGSDARNWQLWEEDGSQAEAIIPALRARYVYVFRARFQTSAPLRVTGNWAPQQLHEVAAAPPASGAPGAPGVQAAQAYLYQWAAAQPANPAGTSVFSWADGTHTGYTGNDGWATAAPINPGTPGLRLWVAARQVLAAATATSTVLNWAAGAAVAAWGQNGQPGLPGDPGDPGPAGAQSAVVYLYQWASSQPANPAGTSTFTWATAAHTAYLGGNGWALDVPDNPGTPGARLWVAKKGITDTSGALSSTVSWASGYSVSAWASNGMPGAAGAPGVQAATPTVYRWAATIPTISGTSNYVWATATVSAAPAGWAVEPGAGAPGQTLWGASVGLVDAAGVLSTLVDWSTAGITARGYAGSNGLPGNNGTSGISARRAYVLTSATALGAGTVTTSGINSLPPANSVFGNGLGWAAQPANPAVGQTLYQSDGLYNPATDQVNWETPYISTLKVGQLSALAVNTGNLSVNGNLRMEGGQINAGGFTGFAWPAAGQGGFHLSSTGLLLGNPGGPGGYVQMNASGEIFMPGFTFNGGVLTIGVSINPNGTLNNGLGGQVTIGGLGYSGDLNATRGAPAGTPVAGTFPGGNTAGQVEQTASNAAQAAAAAQAGLGDKLNRAAADVLTAPITLQTAGAIRAGDTTNGVVMAAGGLAGYKAGQVTFSLNTSGDLLVYGTLATGSAERSGTTMAGSGFKVVANGTGSWGTPTTNLTFDGVAMRMNGRWVRQENLDLATVTVSLSPSDLTVTGPFPLNASQAVTAAAAGGDGPYIFVWSLERTLTGSSFASLTAFGATANVSGSVGSAGGAVYAVASCTAIDRNGRLGSANFILTMQDTS